MTFFLKKQLIKFFMYLLAPFILQNVLKNLRANPEFIFGPKTTHLSWKYFFLVQTIIITFIYLLAFFIVQNFKKILTMDPKLWGCTIFWPKMVHLPQTNFFWKKNIIFIYLLAHFHCAKFKKILTVGLVMRMCHFGAQNVPFAQIRIFSKKKLISLFPLIFVYLHVKN